MAERLPAKWHSPGLGECAGMYLDGTWGSGPEAQDESQQCGTHCDGSVETLGTVSGAGGDGDVLPEAAHESAVVTSSDNCRQNRNVSPRLSVWRVERPDTGPIRVERGYSLSTLRGFFTLQGLQVSTMILRSETRMTRLRAEKSTTQPMTGRARYSRSSVIFLGFHAGIAVCTSSPGWRNRCDRSISCA